MPAKYKPIPGFNPHNHINDCAREFENCCGVREMCLSRFFDRLHSTNLRQLTAELLRVTDVLVKYAEGSTEGNILVFTSSVGENNPQHVMLIRQLASVNVELGKNPITGHNLEMHIVYINKLFDKIKQLKFI